MANYVEGIFRVIGKKERVLEFVEKNCGDYERVYPEHAPKAGQKYIDHRPLDFNKAVPEERQRNNPMYRIYPDIEGPLAIEPIDERVDPDGRKSYFDWHKFRKENWGTKWNCEASEAEVKDLDNGDAEAVYRISVAWDFPTPWFKVLVTKWPDLKFKSFVTEEAHFFYAIATGENGNGEVEKLDYYKTFFRREAFEEGIKAAIKSVSLNPDEFDIGSIEPKGGQLSQWFYVRYNEDVECPSKTTITINIEDKPEFVKTLKESYKKC